jgi:hypothetical protein
MRLFRFRGANQIQNSPLEAKRNATRRLTHYLQNAPELQSEWFLDPDSSSRDKNFQANGLYLPGIGVK